jgi:hypothetical protein
MKVHTIISKSGPWSIEKLKVQVEDILNEKVAKLFLFPLE